MGLKILHSADWHMDAPFVSFEGVRRDVLRQEQLKLPGKIAEVCRREGCDLMLLAGDIFDGKPGREAIEAVRSALSECGVPVFISPGNHDFCQPESPWMEESWPDNVTIFTGALEERVLPELNCRIWGAGYRSMDCEGLLEGFRAEGSGYRIGLLHADPVTTRSPYCPITTAQIRTSGLHYLALGHIHRAGEIPAGDTLCAWPGCPMGRGWDETGEKGVCIVTLEEDVSIRFLPLDTPRFYDEEADISEGTKCLDQILPAVSNDDFYRITLTGDTDEDVEALKEKYAAFLNLFLRDRTQPRLDVWEDVGSDSFRGVYFSMLQHSDDPRAALAAEISKKLLAGREVRLP